jgi:hypothetical protein
MYFELQADTIAKFKLAVWESEMMGLDPEYDFDTLTFNIGTGSIEKVSRIRDKYNLIEIYFSEYEPTAIYNRRKSVGL